ncbi:MAG: ABC transporter ATP-binding protein [Sarcina sp.]
MLKEEKKVSAFDIIKKITPIISKGNKGSIFLCAACGLWIGVSWVLQTYATQWFFDEAVNLTNGTSTVKKTIFYAILLGVVLVLAHIANAVLNVRWNNIATKSVGMVTNVVNKKMARLETIKFEDTKVLEDINKAHQGAYGAIEFIFTFLLILTGYVSYFLLMGSYLYKLNPILILVILCAFLPVILNQFIRLKVFAGLEDESAPLRREFEQSEKYLIDREYFKETRLLGGFEYFNLKYINVLERLNKKIWNAEKKVNTTEVLMKLITAMGYGVTLYLLFISLMKNEISIGEFTAILTSIYMIFIMTEEFICMQIGGMTRGLGSAKNLIRFLDIEEKKGEKIEILEAPSIEVKNISFSYPENNNLILKDINLKINAKETIAIVGENGAGKSTLMRVLLGMYQPTKGQVLIDGKDMKNIDRESIFKNTSAVFQKFEKYKFDLKDNISISDINNAKNDKIKCCLESVDIHIEGRSFEEGLDTMLSREFGGTDLSGGQWQRIAIARGLYKFNNFIVLDEPTAAIDPIEEGKIFNKFKEISKDKTAIIVTHRMGTTKIADKIVVLGEGQILQTGTHEKLISKEGPYKVMYETQSKWYDRIEV